MVRNYNIFYALDHLWKQGLTLKISGYMGPKRVFDKISAQKQDFCIIIYTISGP